MNSSRTVGPPYSILPKPRCQGRNKRTNIRCKNSVLLEFIGPQPKYCAEHIHLQPDCMFQKCSHIDHDPNSPKNCKELVLKEFGVCHKHISDFLINYTPYDKEKLEQKLNFLVSLISSLSEEAERVRPQEINVYQRKYKLITKYHLIRRQIVKKLKELSESPVRPEKKIIENKREEIPQRIEPFQPIHPSAQIKLPSLSSFLREIGMGEEQRGILFNSEIRRPVIQQHHPQQHQQYYNFLNFYPT